MQRRSFLALVVATVILVAGAIAAVETGDRHVSVASAGERALPKLAPKLGDLAWLRLTRGTMKANFSLVGGHWVVVEKGNYPAAEAKVRQLLLALSDLTMMEPKTRLPELYPRLEIDDPDKGKATLVTVQDRTGQVVGEVIVGKRRADRLGTDKDGVYIRRPDEAQVWLARGSPDVSGDLASWLDRRIVDIPAARIRAMVFNPANGGVLVVSRAKADARFAVDNAPGDAKFKADTAIAEPAGALAGLDLVDVKPAADQPVPDTGVTTAAYTTFDGLTVRLRLWEAGGSDWLAIEASGAGAAAAEAKKLNETVQRWRYEIPSYKAKPLRTRLADLIEPPKGS
jgi:hypothetical protein